MSFLIYLEKEIAINLLRSVLEKAIERKDLFTELLRKEDGGNEFFNS